MLYASVRPAAVTVCAASGNFSTQHIRIPIVPQNTRTDRFMVRDAAIRVRAAGARILADGVHARLLRRAIAVPGALDLQDRLGGSASSAAVAHVATRTHADHRANRRSREDPALRRLAARMHHRARILALVVEAGQQTRTVAVLLTLWPLLWLAIDVRIARVPGWAAANGQMVEYSALG